ncbi:MAG: glycosyltransferase family 39 protein [Candidatus Andersenbacteria bacterium]|nr:glycosyltransferase family 39 protein [Candidatus Andersenbacteria bacterium]MBI3250234.1 glycosyltransferase family 39 protein [Candidatus Andersenbacteria bacterium]
MFKDWRTYKIDILFVLLIFFVALIPRIVDLGIFLTADEKNWIGRSYEFIKAFKDVRLNDMLQTTHPGVPALWLMGIAVTAKMFLSHIPFSSDTLPQFIWATQFPIAFVNALAVPTIYIFLRKLTSGYKIPIIASLFIALDPFIIGYSRVAHVDALVMSFLSLAALATIIYVSKNFDRRWLLVSAVLSGLAILTKAPAIYIIPFFWLAVLWKNGLKHFSWDGLSGRVRDFVLWSLLIAVMIAVIWPVFITVVNPKGNANILRRDLSVAIATPHHMSENYSVKAWHYPAALLVRTNPVTLVFALVAVLWVVVASIRRQSSPTTYWLLIAYVFFFVLMMTLGAKKGDRYILPVFPAIDVLAAIGLVSLVKFTKSSSFTKLLPAAAVLYLAFTVYTYHPYALAYANPFFPDNLSQELGWGEGLEQVANWFNENDPKAHVASWYDQELGAYTTARVVSIGAHEQPHIKYVVLYKNMFGRAADHPANDYIDEYYKKREPVFVAHVLGKEFAWVYKKQVYETITGELLPGQKVKQVLAADTEPIVGLDIQMATYNGRATSGQVIITLEDSTENLIHTWTIPVSDIADDSWRRLLLPTRAEKGEMHVSITAEGTTRGNAPTIRRTTEGIVAVRLLYGIPSNPYHSEQTKLLPSKLK